MKDNARKVVENYLQSADGLGEQSNRDALLRFIDWLEEEALLDLALFVPLHTK